MAAVAPRDSGLAKGRPADMPTRGTSDRAGQARADRSVHDELARARAETERLRSEVDQLRREKDRGGCCRDRAAQAWAEADVIRGRIDELHALLDDARHQRDAARVEVAALRAERDSYRDLARDAVRHLARTTKPRRLRWRNSTEETPAP